MRVAVYIKKSCKSRRILGPRRLIFVDGRESLNPMGEHADLKLVSRLLKGDQRAFDAFFASNYPRLYRFALARLDNDHDLAERQCSNNDTADLEMCQVHFGVGPLSRGDRRRGQSLLKEFGIEGVPSDTIEYRIPVLFK